MAKKTTPIKGTETPLLTGKDLTAAIKKLVTDAKELTARLHLIAVSCCREAVETGNLTHMIDFDKAVEHVGRRAIRRWLDKHGPAKWNTKEKTFTFVPERREKAKALGNEYAKGLFNGPTYIDETTEQDTDPFTSFDVFALLQGIIRKHDRVSDVNDARHNFVGYDKVVALLNELAPTYVKPVKAKAKPTELPLSAVLN